MHPLTVNSHDHTHVGRRRFLQIAGAGVSAIALAGTTGLSLVRAASTEALLLNCIDFRLTDSVTTYMSARGMEHEYDQLVMAGGALAAVHPAVPDWNRTFWQHVQVALDLHDIHKVIVMDHRDCGAYRVYTGEDLGPTPDRETQVHAVYLETVRKQINARYPKLEVETLLMSLDGSVLDLG